MCQRSRAVPKTQEDPQIVRWDSLFSPHPWGKPATKPDDLEYTPHRQWSGAKTLIRSARPLSSAYIRLRNVCKETLDFENSLWSTLRASCPQGDARRSGANRQHGAKSVNDWWKDLQS